MDPSAVDTAIKIIKEVGFPIAVATYLLIVMRTTIKDNTAAIRELIAVIKAWRNP